jgi:hypothetical protein
MGQRSSNGADAPLVYLRGAQVDSSSEAQLNRCLDSQIDNLKQDGITFNLCSEDAAKEYLRSHTYLFRIKRYASNFAKTDDGKYQQLDFALLKDLAIIDYEFRTVLEYLVGNAEHGLKIRFNILLMLNPQYDGKQVARLVDPKEEFIFDEKIGYRHPHDYVRGPVGAKLKLSPYSDSLVRKYFPDPEIWNLWECFNLGDLIDAYDECLRVLHKKDNAAKFFGCFRRIRNAVSHSAPILLGAERTGEIPETEFVYPCLRDLFNGRVPAPIPSTIKKSQLVYDYSSFLCMFLIVCDNAPIRQLAAGKVKEISDRICRNYGEYYAHNSSCLNLRSTLGCLVKLSEGFTAYINSEPDHPHDSGTLHFIP